MITESVSVHAETMDDNLIRGNTCALASVLQATII